MRIARRRPTASLAVIAILLVATAWAAVGDRATESIRELSRVGHLERDARGSVAPLDLTDAVVVPMLGTPRPADPHRAPLWVLPGAAASLAALCLLRRQRLRPTRPARRTFLRGSVANRAPPAVSLG